MRPMYEIPVIKAFQSRNGIENNIFSATIRLDVTQTVINLLLLYSNIYVAFEFLCESGTKESSHLLSSKMIFKNTSLKTNFMNMNIKNL